MSNNVRRFSTTLIARSYNSVISSIIDIHIGVFRELLPNKASALITMGDRGSVSEQHKDLPGERSNMCKASTAPITSNQLDPSFHANCKAVSSPGRLSKQEKKKLKEEHRKVRQKEKKERAKVRRRDKLQDVSHEEKLIYGAEKKLKKLRRNENAVNAMNSNINVCIDLSFNDLNSSREQRSLVKQCTLAYAAVRNSSHGVALHISSLNGDVGEALGNQGVDQWYIRRHSSSAFDTFDKENIIVLSPDANHTLTDLDPSKVYVIGGIVDRTVRSNITLDKAHEKGVKALRLPVKEYFPKAQSHVINIDQVVTFFCTLLETNNLQVNVKYLSMDS